MVNKTAESSNKPVFFRKAGSVFRLLSGPLFPDRPYTVFQFLSGPENSNTMRINCYDFSGFRVVRFFPALPGSDFKRSETPELYNLVLCQSLFDFIKDRIHDFMDVFFIKAGLFVYAFNNFSFCQFGNTHFPYLFLNIDNTLQIYRCFRKNQYNTLITNS